MTVRRSRLSTQEPIDGVPVPLNIEAPVDVVLSTPQERVQNRVAEQLLGVPVPQITEDGLPTVPQERVQNRTLEQIMGFLEPQVMEDGLPAVPQEYVPNRSLMCQCLGSWMQPWSRLRIPL